MLRGILFDKDGTLLDFEALWLPILLELIEELTIRYKIQEEFDSLLATVGAEGGTLDSRGIFATGTGEMMGATLYRLLQKLAVDLGSEEEFTQNLIADFNAKARDYQGRIVPVGDVKETIRQLRKRGFKLGISTADNRESTVFCLEELGILDYFDFLGTIDGKRQRPKPHGDILHAFCHQFQLTPASVAVVGDTRTDLLFAKGQGAFAVGVLSGLGSEEDFQGLADLVLEDVNEILSVDCFQGLAKSVGESWLCEDLQKPSRF